MHYTIRIEQAPAKTLAVVRRRALPQELSKVVPECCGLVWNAFRAQDVGGAGRHVAIYYDDAINLEVGVEVRSPFPGNGEVVPSTTPAGTVAATTHYGPYNLLNLAHEAIHVWCRANGRQLAGPRWEIYGHWQTDWQQNPDKITTDVYYLLTN